MGITINPKPSTGGGTGEDTQLRQQFGQHKDNDTHLKPTDKTAIASIDTHITNVGAHMRDGDHQKIDTIPSLTQEVNGLKLSASEVKNNIAQALTDKGYPTSPSATGKQMADTIRSLPSGGSQSVSGNYTLGFGIQTLPYVPFKPKAFRVLYVPNGYDIKAQFSAVISENENTLVGGIEQNMQNFVIAGLLHDGNGYALQLINTTSNNINMEFTYYG